MHRGRALAAFNHILDVRVQKLKSEHMSKEKGGQTIVQSDVQMLLAPLTQSEESLLSSVCLISLTYKKLSLNLVRIYCFEEEKDIIEQILD